MKIMTVVLHAVMFFVAAILPMTAVFLAVPDVVANDNPILSTTSKADSKIRQEILAVRESAGGNLLVALEEIRDKTVCYRVILLDETGKVLRNTPVDQRESLLPLHHKLIPWKEGYAFGWIDSKAGMVVVPLEDGDVKKIVTVLADDPAIGPLGEFWVLDVAGKRRLMVARHRYIAAEGLPKQVGRQYTWLYCYSLDEEKPKFLGCTNVEDDQIRSGALSCASEGDKIFVWQTVYEKNTRRRLDKFLNQRYNASNRTAAGANGGHP